MSNGLIMFALVGGIIAYLIAEHSLIFWFVFLPIVVIVAIIFFKWLKK